MGEQTKPLLSVLTKSWVGETISMDAEFLKKCFDLDERKGEHV